MRRHRASVLFVGLLILFGCVRPDRTGPPQGRFLLADLREPEVVPTYLAICPEKAIPDLMPLATWRSTHGHTVRTAAHGW